MGPSPPTTSPRATKSTGAQLRMYTFYHIVKFQVFKFGGFEVFVHRKKFLTEKKKEKKNRNKQIKCKNSKMFLIQKNEKVKFKNKELKLHPHAVLNLIILFSSRN